VTWVPVQIDGAVYDKTARTMRPVRIVGYVSIVGLTVGGGPVLPQPPNGGQPPPGGEIPQWDWAWSPGQGWHIAWVPSDKPQPPPINVGGGGGTAPEAQALILEHAEPSPPPTNTQPAVTDAMGNTSTGEQPPERPTHHNRPRLGRGRRN